MNNLLTDNIVTVSTLLTAAIALVFSLPALAQGGRGAGNSGCSIAVAVQPVTPDEASGLAHMREEEKLARDVCGFRAMKIIIPS